MLSLPFVNTVDYDNVFLRCPASRSLEVTVLSGGEPAARAALSREAYEAVDATRLRAEYAAKVVDVSTRETAIAQKYEAGNLFSPLLFDAVVTSEDKSAIDALEAERRRAEDDFYRALFGGGVLEIPPTGGRGNRRPGRSACRGGPVTACRA